MRDITRTMLRRDREAFTLIEILVVIVIIGVLATMGVSKYTEFTTDSRKNACISNQTGVDKGIGVWESQRVAITRASRVTVTFAGSGNIGAVVGTVPTVPAPNNLAAGSRAIANYIKDDNLFMCPEYASQQGGFGAVNRTYVTYMWVSDTTSLSYLNNKSRGVACLTFSWNGSDTNGPDGTTGTRHR